MYAVLDVEKADPSEKGSICAIGIVWVDSGQIVDRFYSLVNPCCSFNSFCMDIHHITPQDVQDSPTFSQLWPQIYPKLNGIPLVSYNAPADIYALEKALYNAGIPDCGLPYTDAYRIVKRLFDFPSYKLSEVAPRLGIKLNHAHNALADAEATANLIIFVLNSFKFTALDELLDFCGMDMQDTLSNTYYPACDIKPRKTAKKKKDIAPAVALSHGNSNYFAGKNVLFTGDLSCTTREMAQQAVCEMGGICKHAASRKINVCVVGTYDKETLCLGATMGIKLQKVLELKAKGYEIEIINESEFLSILGEECG